MSHLKVIDLALVKMESLKDFRNQFETKISWARVATLKHNKSKNKKQKVACPLQMTLNYYNLLCNDTMMMMMMIMIIHPLI
jgi:hypothetical protein